jgi:hypothetical protein
MQPPLTLIARTIETVKGHLRKAAQVLLKHPRSSFETLRACPESGGTNGGAITFAIAMMFATLDSELTQLISGYRRFDPCGPHREAALSFR